MQALRIIEDLNSGIPLMPSAARIIYECNVDVPGQRTINSKEYLDCSIFP